MSQLRKVLGEGVLETRGRGYALQLAADQLDAEHFEHLLVTGRELLAADDAQGAADALREGLGLWRGPPLSDFAYEPFAASEIARLDELRLTALEARIEADLALGRHRELVSELEGLTRQHPLREGLRVQLMLALYRSGRQADALDGYKHARAALDTELGLDPSRELQELEQAILRQDPELDAPAVSRGVRERVQRRGGRFVAFGGVLLLAAAVLAGVIALTRDDGDAGIVSAATELRCGDRREDEPHRGGDPGGRRADEHRGRGRQGLGPQQGRSDDLAHRREDAIAREDLRRRGDAGRYSRSARDACGSATAPRSSVVELDPDSGATVRTIAAPPLTPPPRRAGQPYGGAIATGLGAVWFSSGNATITRIDPSSGRGDGADTPSRPDLRRHLARSPSAKEPSGCRRAAPW